MSFFMLKTDWHLANGWCPMPNDQSALPQILQVPGINNLLQLYGGVADGVLFFDIQA